MIESSFSDTTVVAESAAVIAIVVQRLLHDFVTNYDRRVKAKAYRLRKRWKAGDKAKVEQLGPSPIVQRRLARVKGRGRPVVADYVPANEYVAARLDVLTSIFDPNTEAQRRLKDLKNSPWRDLFIEAVYSGELAVARAKGVSQPLDHARNCTARAFTMNRDDVKLAVGRARKERSPQTKSGAMLLPDLEHWQRTGELPKFLRE